MSETKSLHAKLAVIMAELERVPKRGRNDFHKYDYVLEADLLQAVRMKLAERKVLILPSLTSLSERAVTTDRGKHSTITRAEVCFTFVDAESGEREQCPWAGEGDDPGDKGLNKAYTAALKFFLMKAFLIPTGDDPEGDSKTDERASGRAPSTPKSNGKQSIGFGKATAIAVRALEVVDFARFRLAATHIVGHDVGEINSENDVVRALKSFSPDQAKRLAEWVETKANEKATA